MKQPKLKRASRGKPPLSDIEKTVYLTVRVTPTQRDKFKALGGSKWLRNKIDEE